MSTSDRNAEIKSYFQRGDIPTQEEFGTLVDAATTDQIDNERLPEQVDLTQNGADSKVTAKAFVGDGNALSNLDAGQLITGTIDNARLADDINLVRDGKTTSISATNISGHLSGNGAQVSDLNADNITSGTLDNARLSDDINLVRDGKMTSISATNISGNLSGNGAQVSDLNADNISSGTIDNARLSDDINLVREGKTTSISATNITGHLSGNGSQISDLNASNLKSGQVSKTLLSKANQSTEGIAKFANSNELAIGATNSMISAGDLKTALEVNKNYVDSELALLQAGIKFKKEVATVFTDNYDLNVGVPTGPVNGYLIQTGDRVLFSAQTELSENKVWVAQADQEWLLAEDFDNTPEQELSAGISVEVLKGGHLEYTIWTVSEVSTVDTQVRLTWRKRNDVINYQPGDGIVFDGLTIKGDENWVEGVVQNTAINASSLQGEIASDQIASTIENKTFSGNGTGLTDLNADNMTSGRLDITRLPSQLDFTQGDTVVNSSIQAGSFIGNGSGLSNLDASKIFMGQMAASLFAETGQNWDFDAWFARSLKAHLREMEVPFDFLDKYGFKDLTPVSHMGQYGTAQFLDYQYYTVVHSSGKHIIRERLGRWDLAFGQSGLLALPRPNDVYLYSFNNSLYAIEVTGARLNFYRQESSAIDGTLDLEQEAFFFESAYVDKEHQIKAFYHDIDYLYVHIEVIGAAPVESLILRMNTQGEFASHSVNAQVTALFVGDGSVVRVLTENDVYDLDNTAFTSGVVTNLATTYNGMFNKTYLNSQIFYLEGGEGQISWTNGNKDSFFLSQNENVKTDFSISGISDTLSIHDFYIVKDRLVGIWFSTLVGQNYQHYFTVIDIVNNTLLASYNNGQPFEINHDLLFAMADQNHILLNVHPNSFRLSYLEQGNIMQVVNIPTA
ncbi:hypothetical protein PSECIP111951_00909 [Pseudoalteromonas holothuriae]|uniref:Uncharacterized protein n=1 Tax=Pseudoalteromonas holothuriae TaxID=2963714 RepID=A0A9W4QWE3_9GAMM|nr:MULTISPECIES: hypothetical protein [unclassified Pseudoalteromonas]CAH9053863.1 hypothetical protein PSECIP111951_00909 [Pseudoalteromonas sp. CIP111951]CAH9055750.1 hypothetical protein PSECIP111854_01641 [Pseudoalteromonas sp. CIP111854]